MKGAHEENAVRMELKYCERCGGLGLRPAGSGLSFCERCAAEMAQLPAVRLKTPCAQDGEEGRRP